MQLEVGQCSATKGCWLPVVIVLILKMHERTVAEQLLVEQEVVVSDCWFLTAKRCETEQAVSEVTELPVTASLMPVMTWVVFETQLLSL